MDKIRGEKSLAFIWMLLGVIGIIIGIRGYVHYTSGAFYITIIPEIIYLKDILLGILSIIIGIGLWKSPIQYIKMMFALPFWILIFIISATLNHFTIWGSLDVTYFLTVDYGYFFLSMYSARMLEQNLEMKPYRFSRFFQEHYSYVLLYVVLFWGLIWGLGELLPYDSPLFVR